MVNTVINQQVQLSHIAQPYKLFQLHSLVTQQYHIKYEIFFENLLE